MLLFLPVQPSFNCPKKLSEWGEYKLLFAPLPLGAPLPPHLGKQFRTGGIQCWVAVNRNGLRCEQRSRPIRYPLVYGYVLDPCIPCGVGPTEGVIPYVAVAVGVLQVLQITDDRIRLQHPPDQRVVEPSVHVDQPDVVELFVAGVAAAGAVVGRFTPVDDQAACAVVAAVGVAAFAKGVVGVAGGEVAGLVGGGGQGFLVVAMPVFDFVERDAAECGRCDVVAATPSSLSLLAAAH